MSVTVDYSRLAACWMSSELELGGKLDRARTCDLIERIQSGIKAETLIQHPCPLVLGFDDANGVRYRVVQNSGNPGNYFETNWGPYHLRDNQLK